ncbi:hypothetical protein ACSFA8_02935 [Variovorax sp. RT4R15]|uniref:hypothetical protein n=1 Tax=Variovorax sp. RT4R15 TaxID=3443737 RepID=UPI003F480C11
MSRRSRWPFLIVLLVITALFFYWFGAQRQLARSTFANTVALKFEEACLRTNDVECLRSSWTIRATAASKLAHGLVEGLVPGRSMPSSNPMFYGLMRCQSVRNELRLLSVKTRLPVLVNRTTMDAVVKTSPAKSV